MPNSTLFLVKNRTGLQFRLGLISSVIVILAQLGGVVYGLEGVAIAYAAAMLLSASLFWAVAFRLIGQTAGRVATALDPPRTTPRSVRP